MPAPSAVNRTMRRPGTQAKKHAVSTTEQPKSASVRTGPDHQGAPVSCMAALR
ncbi:hypothetical protein STENM327S_09349 [Streptomyces tendae]